MHSITALAVLAALPSIYAISLSDFQPHLQNLPLACNIVYTAQVPGCKSSDFTAGYGCSTSCIAGLQATLPGLQLACSSADVFSSTNVINTFLTSGSIQSLCPNAPAPSTTAVQQTPTSTTQTPTSTEPPSTTTAVAATTDSSTSSTSTTSTSSTTAVVVATTAASTTSSSSVSSNSQTTATSAVQSSASPIFIYSTSTAGSAPSSTSNAAAQATQNNSGGGSPFDTTSMAAGITAGSSCSFALFLSALLAAYVL